MGSSEYRTIINLTLQFIFILSIVFLLIAPLAQKIKTISENYINSIPDDIPDIYIRDGGVDLEGSLPSRFYFPNGSVVLFMQNASREILSPENRFSLLITPDLLYFKLSENNIITIHFKGLSVDEPGDLTPKMLRSGAEKIVSVLLRLGILFLLLLFVICYNVIAVIAAGLASILNTIFNGELTFHILIFTSSCLLFIWFSIFLALQYMENALVDSFFILFFGYVISFLLFTIIMLVRMKFKRTR
ncbi:hypothetical protein GF407_07300 [candidate division KSB1 bacterium]|nr:hypothetical protein [candidate division KSB1 bacterium]